MHFVLAVMAGCVGVRKGDCRLLEGTFEGETSAARTPNDPDSSALYLVLVDLDAIAGHDGALLLSLLSGWYSLGPVRLAAGPCDLVAPTSGRLGLPRERLRGVDDLLGRDVLAARVALGEAPGDAHVVRHPGRSEGVSTLHSYGHDSI